MKTKIGLPLGLALVMFIGIFTTMLALGALNPQPVAAITTVTVTLASTDGGTYTGNVDIDATTAVTFSELDSNSVSNTLTISLPLIFDVSKEDAIEDESKWTLGGTAPSSVELTVGAAGVGGADDTPHTIVLTAGSGMTDITVAPPAVGTIPVDYRPDANIGLKLAIEGATGVTISVEVSTEPDLPGTSAEFDIDPAPAVDGGFSVNVGYPLPGEVSSYSFTVTAEEEFGADDTLTITFPVGTGLGAMSVGTADNWTLGGSVPQTVTVTASERMVELTAPSSNFGTITTGNDIVVEALESAGIVNPPAGTGLTFSVTTNEAPNAGESLGFSIVHDPTVDGVRAIQDPTDPGANAQYQISFTTAYGLMANVDTIRFNFDSSIGAPTSVAKGSVIISASNVTIGTANVGGQAINLAFDPIYRPVPGGEGRDYYTIRVPDMDPREEYVGNIDAGATVTVTFLPSAGLTNATEKGGDDIQVSTTKQQTETNKAVETGSVVDTPLMLTIDDAGDNRNKPLTVTGKGFRNNTTAIVYLDKNGNNMRDDVDVDLVSVLVGSDDTFQATFQVTVPPFEQGKGDASDDTLNKINAVDGEAPTPNHFTDGPVFEVEGLISVTPKSVAVGDKLQISLVDWPNGSHSGYDPSEIDPTKPGYVADPTLETARLLIGGLHHKLPNIAISNNSADFEVEVANDVPEGTPQIEFITTDVGSGAESDDTTITIAGADVTATPVMVVPHQTVTVVGLGFGDRAKINTGDSGDTSEVKFGGDPLYLTSGSDNFNNGSGVTTDSGGNWNASVVVPITGASATPGYSPPLHKGQLRTHRFRCDHDSGTPAHLGASPRPGPVRPSGLPAAGFPATTSRPAEQTTPSGNNRLR